MSNQHDKENERMDETTKVVLAALIGAGVGAAATLLFTTDKGSELRQLLKKPIDAISDSLDELADSGKELAAEAKQTVEETASDIKQKTS